ncbi:tyrosine-type recombinase/integrase, partial [Terribacillus saccharophilus]|uniref:tyrosine-type recombinase/integrase n=1 Tax=Terribacillus saccharophilus TaxID=361277 RepID=UPI003982021B
EKFFGESEYIFLSAFGDPLKPDAIRRLFHRYAKRAGLSQIQPGRFRHTFAIKYLKKGGDIMTLSKIMGHSSLKTTENYLQFSREDIVAAHEKFAPSKDFYRRKVVRNI